MARLAVCLWLILTLTLCAGTASARSVPPVPVQSDEDVQAVLPKTLIYISVSSLIDVGIGYTLTGGLASGTAVAVVNAASGWLLYHLHETAWAMSAPAAPPPPDLTVSKLATFTAANAVRLFGLGLIATQSTVASAGFLVANAIGDAAAYLVTDRIWALLGTGEMTIGSSR